MTRERLYIETMESVLSRSSKVMLDTEGGNNLVYLPLDRILNRTGLAGTTNLINNDEAVSRKYKASESPQRAATRTADRTVDRLRGIR